MFILEKVPAVPYAAPWDLPYQERLNMLRRGSKRVAYFVESANCSTFRYRVYNMVQVLNDQPEEVSASYFFLSDMHHVNDIANCADMLVICRARYDHHIYHLIHAFKRRNKKVLFDVDDLVFNTDYAHLACKTTDYLMGTGQEWDYWFAYMSRMGATLRLCDGGIATNAFLADHMHAFSGLPMNAVPNFLNREQLDISNTIFELRQTISCKQDDNISIGYFSGSPSHVHDFAIALPAIESLLTEMPNLSLALTGYIDANVLRSRFGRSRIHYFQFSDFINLQRLIGSVDFNLVPLQHNAFTQCKSELKYFEAAVVGTVTIASPSFTYQQCIRDGDNGYLSQAHQWKTVLKKAMNEWHSDSDMARRARQDAIDRYAWFNQRSVILTALAL